MYKFQRQFMAVSLVVVVLAGLLTGVGHAGANSQSNPDLWLISDFEELTEQWTYIAGDKKGISGSYERIGSDVHGGEQAGLIQADFSKVKPGFTSIRRNFSKTDIQELSFWVKTADLTGVVVRTVDATGQFFQHKLPLAATTDWQQVSLLSMTSSNYWGGANDGVWHGPILQMSVMVTSDYLLPGKSKAALLVDDMWAKTGTLRPQLSIQQTKLGNVFVEQEPVKFKIRTSAEQLKWKATDFWGNQAASGILNVTNDEMGLTVPVTNKGHFQLEVEAVTAGQTIETERTSFAVLPEKLDLSAVDQSPFGVATHLAPWPKELISLIDLAGIKHIRDEVWWDWVETQQGQYQFIPAIQSYMDQIKAASIDPLIVLSFNNPFYDSGFTPYTDTGRAGFANYSREVIAKYADQIGMVEVYNEFDGGFSSGPGARQPAYYYQLLKKTYESVKSQFPDVKVAGPVTEKIPLQWLEELFQQGGGTALNYMDAVTVHPYVYYSNSPKPEGLDILLQGLDQLIKTYNQGNGKPIWVTEWGWPTHEGGSGSSEIQQANYLVRGSVQMLSEHVEKMFWYDFMNDGIVRGVNEHNFGLVRHMNDPLGRFAPKPAYVSYAVMTRQLTGADFVQQEPIADHVYSYLFDKEGQSVRTAWATEPKQVTLHTNEPIKLVDMMGNESILTPLHGKIYLSLSEDAVYLLGNIQSISEGVGAAVTTANLTAGRTGKLTLSLTNQDQNEMLNASVKVLDQNQQLQIAAGASGEVQIDLPVYTSTGKVAIPVQLYADGKQFGRLIADLTVNDFISVAHIIQSGLDVFRLQASNLGGPATEVEEIRWKVGSEQGRLTFPWTIESDTKSKFDLSIPIMEPGAYDYELELLVSGQAAVKKQGRIVLRHNNEIVKLYKNGSTASGVHTPDALPTIDLYVDGDKSNYKGTKDPQSLSGDIWINWDEDYFYMKAAISDEVHAQSYTEDKVWNGDSMQFAFSPRIPGEDASRTEYGLSLTPQGPQLYRWSSIGGKKIGLVDHGNYNVIRDETHKLTTYSIALPWSELAPIHPQDGVMGFSLLVNDNDGDGRKGWIEWGSGIGGSKQSSLYKPVIFDPNLQKQEVTVQASPVKLTATPLAGDQQVEITITNTLPEAQEITVEWGNTSGVTVDKSVETVTVNGNSKRKLAYQLNLSDQLSSGIYPLSFTIQYGTETIATQLELEVPEYTELLRDDFATIDAWSRKTGSWTLVQDGAQSYYKGRPDHADTSALTIAGDTSWNNYLLAARTKVRALPNASLYNSGIVFRYVDDKNYYLFRIGSSGLELYRQTNGSFTMIANTAATSFTPDQWYTLAVSVIGSQIKGYVDGKLLLEHNDTTFANGAIGLRPFGGEAQYDWVTVTEVKPAPNGGGPDPEPVDKSELQAVIERAQTKLDLAVVGNELGQYFQEDVNKLQLAIVAAEQTLQSGTATEVTEAITRLEQAIQQFLDSAVKEETTGLLAWFVPGDSQASEEQDAEVTMKVLEEKQASALQKAPVANTNSAASQKLTHVRAVSELYAITIKASEQQLQQVEVELPYGSDQTDAGLLGLYRWNEVAQEWEYAGGSADADQSVLRAWITTSGIYAVFEYNRSFSDVSSKHWANRILKELAAKHIIKGASETEFRPNTTVTRAEFASLLARVLDTPAPAADGTGKQQFTDVAVDQWYARDIAALHASGIIEGITEDRFAPLQTITREEIAVILMRTLPDSVKQVGWHEGVSSQEFRDTGQVSNWAKAAVQAVVEQGLMQGRSSIRFAPLESASRAESAAVIHRFLQWKSQSIQ